MSPKERQYKRFEVLQTLFKMISSNSSLIDAGLVLENIITIYPK